MKSRITTYASEPWHVDKDGHVRDSRGLLVAQVWGVEPRKSAEEVEANAAMIAAVPEMADLILRTYANISHGGPTRADAEIVLKKAGLL